MGFEHHGTDDFEGASGNTPVNPENHITMHESQSHRIRHLKLIKTVVREYFSFMQQRGRWVKFRSNTKYVEQRDHVASVVVGLDVWAFFVAESPGVAPGCMDLESM
ncbi:hypothetical protein HRM2_15220 [Desulforapulum autotrophicum HRM2]|uniref:Uncharacterized protein n=1 Tax=Desulforapulum autotrophicum (strain ATCC 43914 / DSM 3382 / VKM B-1955 / HRM2) TaxID=177437 RepID=C0Q9R7_DESAH|nr:hypothetical protein [Desulforapulum autotrophicum]ACN14631.1 hypothetical protein HRM2_15220 [Desulforapulum autotrophicum HRM2]